MNGGFLDIPESTDGKVVFPHPHITFGNTERYKKPQVLPERWGDDQY